jgi:uncharacterized protein YbbC (DUF1343 family)
VQSGIEVLAAGGFAPLRGRRVGLITNHTGVDSRGQRTLDVLRRAEGLTLAALFSPEHGLEGKLDAKVGHGRHPTGLQVWSLYGETRKPTPEMLAGIDCLVFDIQDIGCRFYTYISTMRNAMLAAAEHGLRFVVLDRPNPIGADVVEGPVLDPGKESFVGFHPIPVRHGMTVGELARMLQGEIPALRGLELQVVPMRGYRRDLLFDETGLLWVDPSPNMRNLHEALLYPGIGLLETTNVSVGRGTDNPFERVGAPWIDGRRLAAALNACELPGVRFYPIEFTPAASKFRGQSCSGVFCMVTDRRRFQSVRTGIHFACALRDLFPGKWDAAAYPRLLGDAAVIEALRAGRSADDIVALWQDELAAFMTRRARYLGYRP